MKKKIVFPLLITVLFIVFLLMHVKLEDIIETLFSISPLWLSISFGLYSLSIILRTGRFRLLLNGKVNFNRLLCIISIHNMSNNIMPLRTGEFSYVYLLKKIQNVQGSEGIATLMLARIFDFISISLLFFTSILMVEDLPSIVANAISGVALLLALVILFLITLLYHGDKFLGLIKGFCSKLKLTRFRFINFLMEKLNEVVKNLDTIRSKKIILHSIIYSILIWLSFYSMIYALLKGMNIDPGIWVVVLGSTLPIFTSVLPIQGLAGFGTYEGAWAIVFIPLGISKEIAIASGFAVHVIFLLYSIILGLFGLYRLKTKAFYKL